MSSDLHSGINEWAQSLMLKGQKLQSNAKAIKKLSGDPFVVLKQIRKAIAQLEELGMSGFAPPAEVIEGLESDCLTQEAEFWGRLQEASNNEGWELTGTTNRRLLQRGIFIEQVGHQVKLEGVRGVCTPHVPSLIETLRKEVKDLLPADANGYRNIVQALIDSYNITGGRGEVPIEKMYRLSVLQAQKPAFWSSLQMNAFRKLTRPMFRALLTKLLSEKELLGPSLTLRLGTTIDPKEAWEIYSPGEGRVVQVGRLTIASQGV
jgi:hypothetical protein